MSDNLDMSCTVHNIYSVRVRVRVQLISCYIKTDYVTGDSNDSLWPLIVAIIAALLIACVLVFIIVMVRCRGWFNMYIYTFHHTVAKA